MNYKSLYSRSLNQTIFGIFAKLITWNDNNSIVTDEDLLIVDLQILSTLFFASMQQQKSRGTR